jgi:hypothetical protein
MVCSAFAQWQGTPGPTRHALSFVHPQCRQIPGSGRSPLIAFAKSMTDPIGCPVAIYYLRKLAHHTPKKKPKETRESTATTTDQIGTCIEPPVWPAPPSKPAFDVRTRAGEREPGPRTWKNAEEKFRHRWGTTCVWVWCTNGSASRNADHGTGLFSRTGSRPIRDRRDCGTARGSVSQSRSALQHGRRPRRRCVLDRQNPLSIREG